MTGRVVRETHSLCPVCLKGVPAVHVLREGDVHLEKSCPDHGGFSTILWRGGARLDMEAWRGAVPPLSGEEAVFCPGQCGLCEHHLRDTCCVVLELTHRCNLDCPLCLAGERAGEEPTLDEVKGWLRALGEAGKRFVQLSGGEPTLREDLPEIVRFAKEQGFRYVQLNTNGLRLGNDPNFVKALAEAGLSFVFLQFDGTEDEIYCKLRGRPLLDQKLAAIEHAASCNLGVTLVPTLVPGVNVHNIGEIVRLALSLSPKVRGVHFHPVSYFGRYPHLPTDEDRLTLPELIAELEKQTEGMVRREHLSPSKCDHPLCGFHGDFVILPDGPHPLKREAGEEESCCCGESPAVKNQNFVGRRWERRASCFDEGELDLSTFDGFLSRVRSHGFTITAMAFQDCYNIDLERLRRCSLHVYRAGKLLPLCVAYLTGAEND